jgi:serine protease Do
MRGFVTVLAGFIALTPALLGQQHLNVMTGDPAALNRSTQGYLGVGTHDIDTERAGQLKLKEPRGAEVVNIDHDAPAAKAGMRLHDVILQMNGQQIEGEAQLGQLLRQTPPGRTVTFVISRDGQQQTLNITLCDQATLEADAWSQHIPVEPDEDDDLKLPPAKQGFASGFLSSLGMNPAYTGLELDMLGPQLADYFGIHDGQGLLVKRVDDNSPASIAGLRAGDVITRVNGRVVATTSQWERTIHANKGKQVELTVVRDRRENTVTMRAGRSKSKG